MTTSGPQFEGFNLVAEDLEATVAFYGRLGVDIPDEKIWRTESGAHHTEGVQIGRDVELEIDSDRLAAVYNAGFTTASRTMLGFRLGSRESVDDLYNDLVAAGHEGRQPPCDAFWGSRFAIVADPDGRDVSLMSPADGAYRSAPPEI